MTTKFKWSGGHKRDGRHVASRTDSRRTLTAMFATGGPTLLASGLIIFLPVVGRHFFSVSGYATWALLATVLTVALVLDFGGPELVLREYARGRLSSSILWRASGISAFGSLMVGTLAAVVWPFYARTGSFNDPGLRGSVLFLLCGLAGASRSVFVVYTALLQAREHYRSRGLFLLLQSILQLGTTVLFLISGLGLFSLPLGGLVSSVVSLSLMLSKGVGLEDENGLSIESVRLGRYALARSAANVMGVALTQLDRWVVGANVKPATLTTYDITSRFAGTPRIVVVALSTVVVSAAANASGNGASVQVTLRRALRFNLLIIIGSTIAVALAAYELDVFNVSKSGEISWPLFFGMCLWFGVNSLTAPLTQAAVGLECPQDELFYLGPCLATAVLFWTLGFLVGSPVITVCASGVALLVWSSWFCLFEPRRLVLKSKRAII